ncbi:MAG: hypothetical protein N3A67_06430 [Ignavibacteria bacterium]|nr:hypothetical protein [Ignavibacteria bacterium]
MKKLFLLLSLLLFFSCDDNSSNSSPNNYFPNEHELEVTVDSVINTNKFIATINNKKYAIVVVDLNCYELERNEILTNQANIAGISVDSALSIARNAVEFAKELLLKKKIIIRRDSLQSNSLPTGELLRHVFINGLRYDSIIIAKKLNAPRRPSPDDKEFYAIVNWVYDGDTFDYKYEGVLHKVRVLNIDCYETQINDRLKEQARRNKISVDSALALGLAAKEFAIKNLKGKEVLLIRSTQAPNYDVYNRFLRFVKINGMSYDSLIIANGFNAN